MRHSNISKILVNSLKFPFKDDIKHTLNVQNFQKIQNIAIHHKQKVKQEKLNWLFQSRTTNKSQF